MARFLFRAQDRNMTNGDYVFFTYWSSQRPATEHPFTHYARYVDDPNDLHRRRQAFYVVKQVGCCYLLTPMDRATLPHAESSTSRCTPSVINRRQALRAIFKALCYADRHLSVISTHVHAEAQTPLDRFVDSIFYKHIATNKVTNRNEAYLSDMSDTPDFLVTC